VAGLGEQQRVVLVGGERLLLAGDGPEDDPAVRRGWGPEVGSQLGFHEGDHATSYGVTQGGHDAADVLRGDVPVDQLAQHRGDAPGLLDRAGERRLPADVRGEVDRVGVLQPHQVGGRDQPDRRATLVDHGQVVDAAAHHLEQRLEGQRILPQGQRGSRHHLAHRPVRVQAGREHPVAQVPVGDDAGQAALVDDEDARDASLGHHRGSIPDRSTGDGRHRLPGDEVADHRAQHGVARGRSLQVADRPGQPGVVGRGVEGGEPGVVVGQRVEELGRQHDQQRVLGGRAPVAGGAALQQRAHAERDAGAHPLDQPTGLVDDVHGAGADDVQARPLLAHVEDDGAPARVAQRALPRHPVEHGGRQGVERCVPRQEVADLRQLDVHAAHRRTVSAAPSAARRPSGPPRR
jgi:hypothetical protein